MRRSAKVVFGIAWFLLAAGLTMFYGPFFIPRMIGEAPNQWQQWVAILNRQATEHRSIGLIFMAAALAAIWLHWDYWRKHTKEGAAATARPSDQNHKRRLLDDGRLMVIRVKSTYRDKEERRSRYMTQERVKELDEINARRRREVFANHPAYVRLRRYMRGDLPPGSVETKGEWVLAEIDRLEKEWGLLLSPLAEAPEHNDLERKRLIHLVDKSREMLAYARSYGYLQGFDVEREYGHETENWLKRQQTYLALRPLLIGKMPDGTLGEQLDWIAENIDRIERESALR
jgi:hypothetical protein